MFEFSIPQLPLLMIVSYILPLSIGFLSGIGIVSFVLFLVRKIKRMRQNAFYSLAESIFDESDQLKILVNNLPDSVYIKDNSYKYILANNFQRY